jgi:hypothetical protein
VYSSQRVSRRLESTRKTNSRCISYNCESNGKCGRAADEPIHPPAYSYVLVGLGIVICKQKLSVVWMDLG